MFNAKLENFVINMSVRIPLQWRKRKRKRKPLRRYTELKLVQASETSLPVWIELVQNVVLIIFCINHYNELGVFSPNHVRVVRHRLMKLYIYTNHKKSHTKTLFVQNVLGSVLTPYGNLRHKKATVVWGGLKLKKNYFFTGFFLKKSFLKSLHHTDTAFKKDSPKNGKFELTFHFTKEKLS